MLGWGYFYLCFLLFSLFLLTWSSHPALVIAIPAIAAGMLAYSVSPPCSQHGLFMDMVDVCIIAGANGVEVKERK